MHATIAQSYEEVECPPLLEKVLYDHMDNREDFIEISKIEPFTKLPLRLVPEKGSKLHPPLFMYGWYADRDKLLDYAALNGLTAAVDEKKSKKEKKGKGGRKGKEGKETANEDHSSTQQSHNAESTRTAPRRRKSSVHDREFMQKAIVDLLGKHQLGDYSNNVELHNTLYKALGHDSSVIITLFTNYSLDKELAFETVDAIQKALEAPEAHVRTELPLELQPEYIKGRPLQELEPFDVLPHELVPSPDHLLLKPPMFMYGWIPDEAKLLEYATEHDTVIFDSSVEEELLQYPPLPDEDENELEEERRDRERRKKMEDKYSSNAKEDKALSTFLNRYPNGSLIRTWNQTICVVLCEAGLEKYAEDIKIHSTPYAEVTRVISIYGLRQAPSDDVVDKIYEVLGGTNEPRRWYLSSMEWDWKW
ncbi:predicted protein [Postia placenta Mad-698-R]|nr:predicted protein [Postia placenta Mad-698-R]